ncbi:MAG: uroporphyrinogen-III C-methyltransferase [Lachnospiraceae bacterium]|nr:uroporphyrinogen-III C-methyltransferase [Lachnospiraceae bacterium]
MCKGKVWLVGAGPGDAGLLTIKGRQMLEHADVIVYDALVSTEIISTLPTGTEKINVGKRASNHMASQEEINQLLVDQAMSGKKVVRLKGGDPFVFGRGGEELEGLTEQEIPFEIVPGITSAVAVPAYGGIPVTHREYTSSFHIITGHGAIRNGGMEGSRIDFEALVKLDATLIFLMGIGNLKMICEGLMEAGMEKDTPAAVLERGTNAKQRKVVSTIQHLVQETETAQLHTPAIILVGKVCQLSEQFAWAEKRILGGRQFIVTRPQKRSSKLTERLRTLGAQVIEMPGIETNALPLEPVIQALKDMTESVYQEEWLVFTSPVGVITLWDMMREKQFDLRGLFTADAKVRFAAIGSGTAGELENRGIIPDVIPAVYHGEALGQAIAAKAVSHARASVFRAREGSQLLIPAMETAGITCRDIPVYETSMIQNPLLRDQVTGLFRQSEIDAVTFTSASTVKSFTHAMADSIDYRSVKAICIGEQTADEARKYDMKILVSDQASMDSMVELLIARFGYLEKR